MSESGTVPAALDAAMVRAAFPAWHVAQRATGGWLAFRGGLEMSGGPRSLLRCVLGAPTLADLAERLAVQEYLDGLSPEELAGVWARPTL